MATFQMFGKFGANALGGEAGADAFMVDYISDTLKWSLHTNTYTPNIDTNEVFADATNELTTANGYTAGGATAANKTVSYNATGNVTTFSHDDVSWTASGGDLVFRYAVHWRDSTTDPLIGMVDQTGGASNFTLTNGNTYVLDITASGVFTATAT
jgi:hypothetical protein